MENNKKSNGVGCLGVVLIVFVVLKLCGLIQLSWFWVLSPLWINILIAVIVAIVTYNA